MAESILQGLVQRMQTLGFDVHTSMQSTGTLELRQAISEYLQKYKKATFGCFANSQRERERKNETDHIGSLSSVETPHTNWLLQSLTSMLSSQVTYSTDEILVACGGKCISCLQMFTEGL